MKAIICAGSVGRALIYGDVEQLPEADEKVRIRNSRMIIRFAGIGIFGLASKGPRLNSDTRITSAVPETTCISRQALAVTPEAAAAIDAWPDWQ